MGSALFLSCPPAALDGAQEGVEPTLAGSDLSANSQRGVSFSFLLPLTVARRGASRTESLAGGQVAGSACWLPFPGTQVHGWWETHRNGCCSDRQYRPIPGESHRGSTSGNRKRFDTLSSRVSIGCRSAFFSSDSQSTSKYRSVPQRTGCLDLGVSYLCCQQCNAAKRI